MDHRLAMATALAGVFTLPASVSGQATYEWLYRFRSGAANPVGRLVEAPDGSLWGLTYNGGRFDSGTAFAVSRSAQGAWSTRTVHDFHPARDGAKPWGSLILGRDGNFYGSTTSGLYTVPPPPTVSHRGTIFRMSPAGELSVLRIFTSAGGPGMPVWRLLEASDGSLYGSTCSPCDSTVFQFTADDEFIPLHTFIHCGVPLSLSQGVCPVTQLKEGTDGLLYGQATYGGPYPSVEFGAGTLFRIDPRAAPLQRFALLHAFRGPEGAQPVGGLVDGPGGALLGSAYKGGPFGLGSIFRWDPSGAVTPLHAFRGADGAYPYGGLLQGRDGAFYGTASEGGAGFGTLFAISARGRFRVLHAFTGPDGRMPVELMQARDGAFYGVTYRGGPGGGGTIFRMRPRHAVKTLHAFSAGPSWANTGVIEAADGSFYGATLMSGRGGGAVFKLTSAGMTVLHDFEEAEPGPIYGAGSVYPSGLVQGADGFLYGTTRVGGAHNRGTVFRTGTTGGFTVLHSFAGDVQCYPVHGVIQASDGCFYGSTHCSFGPSGPQQGTVFRIDVSGTVTTLHVFAGLDGQEPTGPLVEGADGRLYGMTRGGGAASGGTVFGVTVAGDFAVLHSFEGSDGEGPTGSLARAADGYLYGVTTGGGEFDHGTLFRLKGEDTFETVHSFAQGSPVGVLVGRDGALYGVLKPAPPSDPESVGNRFFRFTPDGLAVLYNSTSDDGRDPSSLIWGSDGALYGTMAQGPPPPAEHLGGVFRLTLPRR